MRRRISESPGGFLESLLVSKSFPLFFLTKYIYSVRSPLLCLWALYFIILGTRTHKGEKLATSLSQRKKKGKKRERKERK